MLPSYEQFYIEPTTGREPNALLLIDDNQQPRVSTVNNFHNSTPSTHKRTGLPKTQDRYYPLESNVELRSTVRSTPWQVGRAGRKLGVCSDIFRAG